MPVVLDDEILTIIQDDHRWRRFIRNLKPIVSRAQVAGPFLQSNGEVAGDTFGTEVAIFRLHCADHRMLEIADILEHHDKAKFFEFILAAIGALDIWQKDIQRIREAEKELTQDENIFAKEIQQLNAASDTTNHILNAKIHRLHTIFAEKFPEVSSEPLHQYRDRLIAALNEMNTEREYIHMKLKSLEARFPFLFGA